MIFERKDKKCELFVIFHNNKFINSASLLLITQYKPAKYTFSILIFQFLIFLFKNYNNNLGKVHFVWFIFYNYITMYDAKNIKFSN
jgi:hypothetical protein